MITTLRTTAKEMEGKISSLKEHLASKEGGGRSWLLLEEGGYDGCDGARSAYEAQSSLEAK